jgi:hypothetical protein
MNQTAPAPGGHRGASLVGRAGARRRPGQGHAAHRAAVALCAEAFALRAAVRTDGGHHPMGEILTLLVNRPSRGPTPCDYGQGEPREQARSDGGRTRGALLR